MAGVAGRSGGRNARTTQEHALRGTYRDDRHGGHESPAPPKGTPTPPKPLDGDAAEEWTRMVERLTQTGAMSTVDDGALYQYCCLFAETEAIAVASEETKAGIAILEENIRGLKGPDLVAVFQEIAKLRQLEARYISQSRQGRMALRVFLVEFGLTPASRSRVKLTESQKPTSKWDGLIQ